jgi:TolA-binding protein
MSCERGWEARALDEGRLADADVASFRRHARGCRACNAELAGIEQLRALTAQLPGPEPDALELRRVRARVLRDAAMSTTGKPRRQAVLGALAAVAAAILIATALLRHSTTRESFAATVAASPGSVWAQTRAAGVERVVLTRGTTWLRVRRQTQGERFLVVVPDGEIEVRGTTFEVSVEAGQTTRVHVDDGVVNVKVVRGEATLSAGQTWPALPQSTPDEPTTTSSSARASPISQVSPTATAAGAVPPSGGVQALTPRAPASVARSPRENAVPAESREADDYAHAIETYRLGRSAEAAELFHAFTAAYPASSLLDDASFLEASSLATAGRADAAALVAERHLAHFPDSFHRKAAAILVARVRRDQGNCDGARAVLKPWMRGAAPDPDVVDAVGACGIGR